uniref:C-type lectin domain-containing protein n=1 Tax=Caenorhabditis tropicalis TaxID=1561998 RepID=A0A1I7TGX5_9PELO
MKNLLLLLILVSSTTVTIGQDFDESLQRACEVMGDHYKKREHRKSVEGDKCELKFKVATRDDEDARQFCELNAPWRLIKVERTQDADRHFTICHVEATLMCQPGWVQMFGHCFKMPNKKKVATREEAVNMCKEAHPDADIAFMHHRYIVGVWKNYFRGLKQIWVRATESWDKYIQKTDTVDGDSLALAFSGKHFRFSVFYNSLIKILPDIRLQVLCEYKPPITNAEINFLGKRYSEIYYPVVTVKTGILVRSASSYTGSADILDICKVGVV